MIDKHAAREVVELRFPAGRNESMAAMVSDLGARTDVLPDRVLVYTDDGDATLLTAHERGARPDSALVRRATLEDVFLHLTGRTMVD